MEEVQEPRNKPAPDNSAAPYKPVWAPHSGSDIPYPLFSSQQAYFAYLTLDEALIRGLVAIGEIYSQDSVPEFRLTNNSDPVILILEGGELVGAKQNRNLNTTMLIPPQKVTVIPVTSVEQGCWTYKCENYYSEGLLASPAMRAM